jgi:hypothetical protein
MFIVWQRVNLESVSSGCRGLFLAADSQMSNPKVFFLQIIRSYGDTTSYLYKWPYGNVTGYAFADTFER